MYQDIVKLSRHFLNIGNRQYQRQIVKDLVSNHRCILLLGHRGVGKTTTLIQVLLHNAHNDAFSNKILYVPTDHFLMGKLSLYEIADQFQRHGGEYIVFDEIHKYPDWSKELKSLYDTFPKLTIYASGSSALEIHKGTHDLSRRAIINYLCGLSFREYIELNHNLTLPRFNLTEVINNHERISHKIINQLEENNLKIVTEFNHYLEHGYYPYFLDLNNTKSYWMTLEQNIHYTLDSDMVAIHKHLTGNSIQKIKKLISFIAGCVPFTPNWKNIRDATDIQDDRTLKTYFKYIEDAGIIQTLKTCSQKMNSISADSKIYLANPNQIQALASGTGNKGNIRETFFMNMLSVAHQVCLPVKGDFLIDKRYTFEVGGRNKSTDQITDLEQAYLACDDIDVGIGQQIPLWLFGFMY